ncbi:Rho Gtpase-Activating Protein 40 [Manis pentadactyla]|nr:Rho Gtpase-Activating Protein 40 [Manis pentadactyla]
MKSSQRKNLRPEGKIGISQSECPEEGERESSWGRLKDVGYSQKTSLASLNMINSWNIDMLADVSFLKVLAFSFLPCGFKKKI